MLRVRGKGFVCGCVYCPSFAFCFCLVSLCQEKTHRHVTLGKLYLLPFKVTKEVKLSMFQFKIIYNILCTKSLLFKMKKEASPRCPFCPADHTVIHLFTECAQAMS